MNNCSKHDGDGLYMKETNQELYFDWVYKLNSVMSSFVSMADACPTSNDPVSRKVRPCLPS